MWQATLELEDVVVRRNGRSLVDGVSLLLPPAKILAILGPNGAGKSSLLKAILGLLPLARGRVLVEGNAILGRGSEARARMMAYVPQQSALNVAVAAIDVVKMGRFAHPCSGRAAQQRNRHVVEEAMALCGVTAFGHRPFSELSGGERSRVLLARALATEARLLLLDEPTHALDVAHTLDCLALLRKIADEGRSVVMVTHDLNQVAKIVDNLLLMKDGRMVAHGSPKLLLADRFAEKVFDVRLVPWGAFDYVRRGAVEETHHA